MRFREVWNEIEPIGRTGDGYQRYAWSAADMALREWFGDQAASRGLSLEEDGNGNMFAWWDPGSDAPAGGDSGQPHRRAVLTGSHFDSVPNGGAYDGPLGIVSGFLAVDELRARGVRPARPLGVAAFVEEEGARFGVACLGSRLLTGAMPPEQALALRDSAGVTLADAMARRGADPAGVRARPDLVARIGAYVELHIEQGRALADVDSPVGVGTGIWPHGRWRLDLTGEGNHAGTTPMGARRDPMLTFAYAVLGANKEARMRGGHATMGRVSVLPNATNAVPASVTGWLDARAPSSDALDALVSAVRTRVADRAARDHTRFAMVTESVTPAVSFDPDLVDTCVQAVHGRLATLPRLATAAGHDAGVLAGHVPAAMLFVRNPTGVSHAPGEHATDADCAAGVSALADVLSELVLR